MLNDLRGGGVGISGGGGGMGQRRRSSPPSDSDSETASDGYRAVAAMDARRQRQYRSSHPADQYRDPTTNWKCILSVLIILGVIAYSVLVVLRHSADGGSGDRSYHRNARIPLQQRDNLQTFDHTAPTAEPAPPTTTPTAADSHSNTHATTKSADSFVESSSLSQPVRTSAHPTTPPPQSAGASFTSCGYDPSIEHLHKQFCSASFPSTAHRELLDWSCFYSLAAQTIESAKQSLTRDSNWFVPVSLTDTLVPPTSPFRSDPQSNHRVRYHPFVTRQILPDALTHSGDSRVAVWGDLHGSMCSFITTLKHLRDENEHCISDDLHISPNCRMIILGDVVDRGPHAVDVMWLLFHLIGLNSSPADTGRVWWIRGNHEHTALASRYGLADEIHDRFGDAARYHRDDTTAATEHDGGDDDEDEDSEAEEAELHPIFNSLFNVLPAALYLGVCGGGGGGGAGCERIDYMQYSHGVWEFGYSPHRLLRHNLASDTSSDGGGVMYESLATIDRRSIERALQSPLTGAVSPPTTNERNAMGWIAQSLRKLSPLVTKELRYAPYQQQTPTQPHSLGLMWHDFLMEKFDYYSADPMTAATGEFVTPPPDATSAQRSGGQPSPKSLAVYNAGRGLGWSQEMLIALMNLPATQSLGLHGLDEPSVRLCGIIRAHQHNNAHETGPMLRLLQKRHGLVDMYDGVWVRRPGYMFMTMVSAPEASLGLRDDSFAIWTFGGSGGGGEWRFDHHHKPHTSDGLDGEAWIVDAHTISPHANS